MLWVLALLLVAAFGGASAQTTTNCSRAPVWMFNKAEDLRFVFPDLQDPLVLVNDGVPEEVFTDRNFATSVFGLPGFIEEIPIVWCIQGQQGSTGMQYIQYSLKIESDDLTRMLDPVTTIPLQGNITTVAFRYRIQFRCLTSESVSTIGITFKLNTSTPEGVEYCPVKFFFGKICSGQASVESPTDLQALGITDGFLEGFLLEGKAVTTMLVPGSHLVPNILKGVLIPLCIIAFLAVVGGVLAWLLWYRKKRSKIAEFQLEAVGQAYKDVYDFVTPRGAHQKEFPPGRLRIVRELGEGAFGVVSQGQAEGIVEGEEGVVTDVAVKQLRPGSNEEWEFFREVSFMSGLDHPNIVRLLGVCSLEEPFSMIFEYMDLGDLNNFLREAVGLGKGFEEEEVAEATPTETEPLLTEQELLTIALQVAEGMVYISSKNLVHRDLASRNCLVATGLLVKIADFGMSRNVATDDYYRVKGSAMLPVRWMPPESVMYGKFTVESDLWAFGVLLWEIFTFGQQPYFGVTNDEVITRIKDCKPPEPPPQCAAHKLMLQCWNKNPKKRPSFDECRKQVQELLN